MFFFTFHGIGEEPGTGWVHDGDAGKVIRNRRFQIPPRLKHRPVSLTLFRLHAAVERCQEGKWIDFRERNPLTIWPLIIKKDHIAVLLLHFLQDRQQLLLVVAVLQDSVNRFLVYGYPGEHRS
jgi:hypothetical protein